MRQLLDDDCWRTCIAYILNLQPSEVPHFYKIDEANGIELAEVWLKERGYALIKLCLPGTYRLNQVIEVASSMTAGNFPYILSGTGKAGFDHAVVAFKDKVILDPYIGQAPSEPAFVKPCSNNIWAVEIIVRLL